MTNKFPIHTREPDFPKLNGDHINFHNYKPEISFKTASITTKQTTLDDQTHEEQNLVIDLTTNNDLTRKRHSDDNYSRECKQHSMDITSNGLRRQTIFDTNDFCCQVNTIEDSEDIDVDVEEDTNDSLK